MVIDIVNVVFVAGNADCPNIVLALHTCSVCTKEKWGGVELIWLSTHVSLIGKPPASQTAISLFGHLSPNAFRLVLVQLRTCKCYHSYSSLTSFLPSRVIWVWSLTLNTIIRAHSSSHTRAEGGLSKIGGNTRELAVRLRSNTFFFLSGFLHRGQRLFRQ